MRLGGGDTETILWFGGEPSGWPGADSTIVVPVDSGRLLMVLSEVRGGWEFPGGRIEQGESAEGAACREAREEAGAVVTNLTPLCRYRVKKHDVTSYGIVFLASVE
ncbi:MAG: NUDIX domain-containing protein, partial [Firmicutes bacterium]|nr:NUDIX domain-containing protein [Bacillota bacterium]